MRDPKIGEIWKEKSTRQTPCWVTFIDPKSNLVEVYYPDGKFIRWDSKMFVHHYIPTGDHVPLEDVNAVLFEEEEK